MQEKIATAELVEEWEEVHQRYKLNSDVPILRTVAQREFLPSEMKVIWRHKRGKWVPEVRVRGGRRRTAETFANYADSGVTLYYPLPRWVLDVITPHTPKNA